MQDMLITDQVQWEQLCQEIRAAGIVAFDTEFVSEFTYRPELCLLQFAIPGRLAAVDPFAVSDLTPWWDLMTDDRTTIVVHGGREEVRFCLTATDKPPRKLVDIQIAEGLRSPSFPLSYANLLQRVLGVNVGNHQTRTDWRKRPLRTEQIEYAVEDVEYVLPAWEKQSADLTQLGRASWAETEFQRLIEDALSERSPDSWTRLSGLHKLKPRSLEAARQLYFWRQGIAEQTNRPLRRILRDDLLVDLARRLPQSRQQVLANRDMGRTEYQRHVGDILECLDRVRQVPDSDLPRFPERQALERNQDDQVLGKLLGIALANRCAEMSVSLSLVGTTSDLRELVRTRVYGHQFETPPRLSVDWRAEVCGDLLADVMDGKVALRVVNPKSEYPLAFERRDK